MPNRSHNAIVQWPIALMRTAFAVDILQVTLPLLPANIFRFFPTKTELSIISYYSLSAGLVAGPAAVLTGVLGAASLLAQKGGIYEPGQNRVRRQVKTLLAHAALNDIVLLASVLCWWVRRNSGGSASVPPLWMTVLSAALVGIQLFAAGLGSTLVYGHSTGYGNLAKGKMP